VKEKIKKSSLKKRKGKKMEKNAPHIKDAVKTFAASKGKLTLGIRKVKKTRSFLK